MQGRYVGRAGLGAGTEVQCNRTRVRLVYSYRMASTFVHSQCAACVIDLAISAPGTVRRYIVACSASVLAERHLPR